MCMCVVDQDDFVLLPDWFFAHASAPRVLSLKREEISNSGQLIARALFCTANIV